MEAVRLTVVGNELDATVLLQLCALRTAACAHGIACSFCRTDFAAAAAAGAGGFTMAGPTEVLVSTSDLDAAATPAAGLILPPYRRQLHARSAPHPPGGSTHEPIQRYP